MSVLIETTLGDITVDLYLNERPRACLNFLKLCKIKYYNFNLFHTISRGFIAQTGDPTGSRTGGECIYGVIEGTSKRFFEAENEPRIKHTRPGLLSFVGGENNMISSQFFLTLGEDLTYLDEKHCVFGQVVEGFDILEAINEVICDNDDRPYQDVRITHTVVLDDPFPDPKGLKLPSRSPSPSPGRLAGGRIAPDEQIDETSGKSNQEIAEMQAEREAKARATILEMVGDIPDAEMAPPENVLFVCKLNPVTTDDDLEIIFSRFGNIKSCEVIRDRKSGDSLQYAFIEFEEQKACEDAYFKMGNVLIDDRRIHVDFSQSVSKVKWLGKGRGVAHYDEKGNKKQADGNNDIGKGDYKTRNGIKNSSIEHRKRSRSPRRQNASPNNRFSNGTARRHYSRSPRREKRRSRSPRRNWRQNDSSDRQSIEREKKYSPLPVKSRQHSRSPLYNRRYNRYPEQLSRRNDYRRRSKSPRRSSNSNYKPRSYNRQKSSTRQRSRSPIRNNTSQVYLEKSMSPKRTRTEKSKPENNSKHINKESNPIKTKNKESRENSPLNKKSVAQLPSTSKSIRQSATIPDNKSSSLLRTEKNKSELPARKKRHLESKKESLNNASKKSKKKRKKPQRETASSDTSETESEQDKPKKKKSKKKATSSSESSSSEDDSSSSSEEEKPKTKSKKRRPKRGKLMKKKKTKKCKKKYSSSESSSSSSSETSSSSSSSSESNDNSRSKKKKSKKRRTSSSSESD